MIFHARDERALARIEASLTRSDPGLAAQFERFNSRVARPLVEKKRARRWPTVEKLLVLVVLSLATVLAAWGTITATGSHRSSVRCTTTAGSTCPARSWACRAPSLPTGQEGRLPSCAIQRPANAPW
jgi:hypothetical protein